MGRLNPSRETKFSGTHGDRGIFIFPVQLTTSRIGNLTRLIHTLLYVMTIHTYIHTYIQIKKHLLKKGLNSHRMSSCSGDGRGGRISTPQAEN